MLSSQPRDVVLYNHIFSKFGYAVFDTNFTFVSASDNFAELSQVEASCIKPTATLFELLDEFFGAKDTLKELHDNPASSYPLNRMNRPRIDDPEEIAYVNLIVRPIPEPKAYLLIVEDVTDEGELEQGLTQTRNERDMKADELQEINEQLIRVNRLKEIFFSMVAHDLRSPLSIISGYANLLKNTLETLQETAAEHIETIRVQSRWLDNSINNMLDLHKIDSEMLALELETCNLCDVVEDTVSFFRPMATLNQLTLSLHLPDKPIYVDADVKRLEQVLQNLLSNAIKYNEPDTGRIDVTVRVDPDSENAEVVVADTGKGMTKTQLESVFQLYYRTKDAESSEVKGTGIGLYIVKMLMEAHGGRVDAESTLDEGTTFHLWLKQVGTSMKYEKKNSAERARLS